MKLYYKLGVACQDSMMKHPYLMHTQEPIEADSYEEAREVFLSDPSVKKAKANDTVMVLATRSYITLPSSKKEIGDTLHPRRQR